MTPDAMLITTWLGRCRTAWAIVTDGATRLATANTASRARVSPVPERSAAHGEQPHRRMQRSAREQDAEGTPGDAVRTGDTVAAVQ